MRKTDNATIARFLGGVILAALVLVLAVALVVDVAALG